MKLVDIERHLRAHNCAILRQGGSHTIWINTVQKKIASVPRHTEIKEGTFRRICKQLEIPPL
jgi:predicted RNA binding protein YcfA (HicA-like mRNA interferase family)